MSGKGREKKSWLMPNHRAETKLRNGNRRRRVEGQTDRESDKQIDR